MADADEEFKDTPEGAATRWGQEFKAAKEALKGWHDSAEECDKQYRDEVDRDGERLGLYAAGIDLKEATLYGNTPRVDVKRRDNDQDDDVARVAAEIKDRLLNGDLEREEEAFPRAIALALKDWLIPGCGLVWERFVRETEPVDAQDAIVGPDGQEQAPAVPATTRVVSEEVETDHVYWKDLVWSPCRVFEDMRWMARRSLLSKKTFVKKFGDEQVPVAIGADPKDNTVPKTPWARIEVWNIWDKEGECVWWYVEGHSRVLVPRDSDSGDPVKANKNGSIPDPLGLRNFWPFPEPIMEGLTTSKLVPRPSYARTQDQYGSINDLTTRIGLLRDAVDASGVYDQTVGELQDILNPKGENKMIPAANYKALAEKGGIAACVVWKPLEAIVAAMNVLRELRKEDIDLVFQVDGTADIMRGQATEGGATATEQAIKAKYGSIRGDKSQKRFARFCSEAQSIRGEIICKHFSPETIAERANVQGLPEQDQLLVQQAIELLQSDGARFRVVVKAESVSLTDYAANKQESMDVIGTMGSFFQSVAPLVQGAPQLGPSVLKLLTAFISRVKGGDTAEPILDDMVKQVQAMAQQAQQQQAMQAQQGPPPNPQLQVAQVRAQAETAKAGASIQQTQLDTQKNVIEHQLDMRKLEAEVRADAMSTAGVQQGAPA